MSPWPPPVRVPTPELSGRPLLQGEPHWASWFPADFAPPQPGEAGVSAGGRDYHCRGWVAGGVSAGRAFLEATSAFAACFQPGPTERFSPQLSPCPWNICLLLLERPTASGPILLSPRHLWAFPPDLFTRGHRQAAGVARPLERLAGNPTAGQLRAGIPWLCLLFFKCVHRMSLSPSSVPGALLSTHGDPRWEHSPGFERLPVQ